MKALLAGYGGIGSNVYFPELDKLGYTVDILDKHALVDYTDVDEIKGSYDLAIVCTPNHTHEPIARKLASLGTRQIFIEKPGVANSANWYDMCETYKDTQFHLVKNNLYRKNYGSIFELMNKNTVIGIDINWLNKNRIPNPGSWFTNYEQAFGGVSHDLMPHLYCFAIKLLGQEKVLKTEFFQGCYQRWALSNIKNTDYGIVDSDGIFDVDDISQAAANINGISLRMTASWKEGYDKQSITLFLKNGETYEWDFGLCPSEAYGLMLQDTKDSRDLDLAIHTFLENFNG